jgi:glycosyltransferase involved in cell wall biosynthesis
MNILMIAPEPFFEPRGTPFSVFGRLRALSQLGHDVDLVTYHVGENLVIPRVAIFRTPVLRFIRHVPVGPSQIKLLLDVLLLFRALGLMLRKRYDLLHTHEEASFFGVLLAWLFGIPHVYDMHSSLPQQLMNFRYTRSHTLVRLFEWLERRAINSSDTVITICPALAEQVKKLNGRVPQFMIENVSSMDDDPQVVSEESLGAFRAAHSLEGRRIVLYVGNLEPYQGVDLLTASARQVLARVENAVFLIVGGNPEQVEHHRLWVAKHGLSSHFRFTGQRPHREMAGYIRLAEVLVSPRTVGTNTPLKIYSYLQSGKPIVATNLPTHTQILNDDVAVLVEPNPDAVARGILSVLEDSSSAGRVATQARKLYESRYSFQAFVKKTEQALQMACE